MKNIIKNTDGQKSGKAAGLILTPLLIVSVAIGNILKRTKEIIAEKMP